jgi:hypothetical protein
MTTLTATFLHIVTWLHSPSGKSSKANYSALTKLLIVSIIVVMGSPSRTPNLLDKSGAAARARAEDFTKMSRVKSALDPLRKTGRFAVVAESEESITAFREGIEKTFGTDKRGAPRTLWLPADGTIQNNPNSGKDKETLQAIAGLRRSIGFVVLAFEGVNFSGDASEGSWQVTNRVTSILTKQDAGQEKDDLTRRKIGEQLADRFKGKYKRDFGVIIIGAGRPSDLPTHADYRLPNSEFLSLFTERVALLESGELADSFPEPVTQEPDQLRLPIE